MVSTDITKLLCTDAGKSTIGGQIMNLTGMVDKRTLEKYEREAKEKSRETWYLSWALDTNQEGEISLFLNYHPPVYVMKLRNFRPFSWSRSKPPLYGIVSYSPNQTTAIQA
jgi:hypothetical protein